MENKEEKSIYRKERFNLKAAQQSYKLSMSSNAERYLAALPKKKPVEAKEVARQVTKKIALDLSELAGLV